MSEIKRGDIWLVNLDPTLGHEIKKSRPAVIIQNDLGNKYSPVTIVAPITSQKTEYIFPFEVLLPTKNIGLQKPSKALLNQIRAVDKNRLVKRFGTLDSQTIEKINDALKVSLGLVDV